MTSATNWRIPSMGCKGVSAPPEFKFYDATHPIEIGMWELAVAAYDHIEGTDVSDALDEVRDA